VPFLVRYQAVWDLPVPDTNNILVIISDRKMLRSLTLGFFEPSLSQQVFCGRPLFLDSGGLQRHGENWAMHSASLSLFSLRYSRVLTYY